jgi:HD-GYP domain-containing protein (c-di-GMP phosphodiesterase class II)
MTADSANITYSDTKHILVLVDSNVEHRRQVVASLMSLYNIVEFDTSLDAAKYIREMQPGIVLVSEDVNPRGGFELVRDLRDNWKLKKLPILMFLDSDGGGTITSAYDCGASDWLVKPYKRSDLIKIISKQFNAAIEAKWETLPPIQAQALKGTVELFNNLSDTIAKGEPIVYGDVKDVCAPLVEAVNSGEFKGILNGVRDHDNYTYAHSLRVAVFLSLFGQTIGLSQKDQKQLAIGGLLHDVGKMYIPHLVLNKPGKLTDDEFEIMKGHVTATEGLLRSSEGIPRGVVTIASQHHEKIDGSGYPRGLKGDELNELARMASIVDVFSALTDRRVYKPSMSAEKALGIMKDEMSHHLDMDLLGRYRKMLLDAAVEG